MERIQNLLTSRAVWVVIRSVCPQCLCLWASAHVHMYLLLVPMYDSWICLLAYFSPQFHNKVTCFMLHHIEEPCSLGAHAAVIVPPTWIIKVKKPQVTSGTLVLLSLCREEGTAASCFSCPEFFGGFLKSLLTHPHSPMLSFPGTFH